MWESRKSSLLNRLPSYGQQLYRNVEQQMLTKHEVKATMVIEVI